MSPVASPSPLTSPCDHLIQAYTDDAFLARIVAGYVTAGLARHDGVVMVATPAHSDAITERLTQEGVDVAALLVAGQLMVLDAERTLTAFMVDGHIDRAAFFGVIGSTLDRVREGGVRTFRAYGEMVDLLWEDQLENALELERLWNELLANERLSLLCAYRIDALDRQAKGVLRQVTHCHSRLLPPDHPERFDEAVERAYTEVFGATGDVTTLRDLMISRYSQGAAVSAGHAALFALDDMPPLIANDIRARARRHYRRESQGPSAARR